jgi:hypothetical protein
MAYATSMAQQQAQVQVQAQAAVQAARVTFPFLLHLIFSPFCSSFYLPFPFSPFFKTQRSPSPCS